MDEAIMAARAGEGGLWAGLDVGKARLDCAVAGEEQVAGFSNDARGWALLASHLRARGVARVGLEATGGYERGVMAALEGAGVSVSRFGPQRVRAYAKALGLRAKNDRIDARLIARFAAASLDGPPKAGASMAGASKAGEPRLAALAEELCLYEQLKEDIARWKTRRESAGPERAAHIDAIVADLSARAKEVLKTLEAGIRAQADLAERLALMLSVPGVGLPTAIVLLVRMPELGATSREQAAALAGLAPFDDESGERRGERRIAGGRARPRRALYAAALAASLRWNAALVAMRKRLAAAGKPHRVVLIACARKLLAQINAVLARKTPWAEAAS